MNISLDSSTISVFKITGVQIYHIVHCRAIIALQILVDRFKHFLQKQAI